MTYRRVEQIDTGRAASDGGGVRLTRVLSPEQGADPFLLLDEFDSSDANDYLAGFPSHPHRGFETVTYMLDGHMLHEDHLGHRGDLKPGGVQWMTAGRGIIHSEMPQQVAGRMRGFQLWLNLPAADKMRPAAYRDLEPEMIPLARHLGTTVRVIAGRYQPLAEPPRPIVDGPVSGGATEPLYFDVGLDAGASVVIATPATHTLLAYVFEGAASVSGTAVSRGQLARLGGGSALELAAATRPARILVIGGRPLGEPVVHYGPFVMNSVAEIEAALRDFRSGRLTDTA